MAEAMSAKDDPLPVSVVTGYLGAGKTTLINRMLGDAHGQRIMVLVNDFGAIALDESLIESRDGDLIALANGCMCCQIGGDLYDAIDRILARRDSLDHLVIETSGVADPGKIGQIALAEQELQLRSIVTLIDAVNFMDTYADPILSDTLLRQIRAAGVLLLTKTSLREPDQNAGLLLELAMLGDNAPIFTNEAELLARLLDPAIGEALPKRGSVTARAERLQIHSVPFESWNWQGEEIIARDRLLAFLGDEELGIYRAKGRLRLEDGNMITVHKVGKRIEISEGASDDGSNRLVCIGTRGRFDRDAMASAWQRALSGSQ